MAVRELGDRGIGQDGETLGKVQLLCREKNQGADRVDLDRAIRFPGVNELLREGGVSGEKDLEGRAVQELRDQAARCPEGELGLVARVLLAKAAPSAGATELMFAAAATETFSCAPAERERQDEPEDKGGSTFFMTETSGNRVYFVPPRCDRGAVRARFNEAQEGQTP